MAHGPIPVAPTFNHVGITVPDLERAIAWYTRVLRMPLLAGPIDVSRDDPEFGDALSDTFGPEFGSVRVAHLATADGTGLELFEFHSPATQPRGAFAYWRTGPFHICLTWPDVAELAATIQAEGGQQRSKIWTLFPSCDYVYCEDPFGNIIEISSRRYEHLWANRFATPSQEATP